MTDDGGVMASQLDRWLERVAAALGEPAAPVTSEERGLLLDLARVAARDSERIAAPITTYAVGLALAPTAPAERASRLRELLDRLGRAD